MSTNEKAPFIAVNGARPIATSKIPNPRPFVKDFSKIPQGKIEGNTLIKTAKRKNFFKALGAWGVAKSTLENGLEAGADFFELRIDDGVRLRISILKALNEGEPRQYGGFEEQVFIKESQFDRLDNPQLDLFEGVGGK